MSAGVCYIVVHDVLIHTWPYTTIDYITAVKYELSILFVIKVNKAEELLTLLQSSGRRCSFKNKLKLFL